MTIIVILAAALFIAVLLFMIMSLRNKTKAFELEIQELKEQVVKSTSSSRNAEQESEETIKKIEELTQNNVHMADALQQQQQVGAKREHYVNSLETQLRELTDKLNNSTCDVKEDEVKVTASTAVSALRKPVGRRGTVASKPASTSASAVVSSPHSTPHITPHIADQIEIGKLE